MRKHGMLEIKYMKPSEMRGYENNSRTHSDEQIKQIADSIEEFGFTNPILIDGSGRIIAGHGRLMASELLKLPEVPTIALNGLTDAQVRALVIADNKLALNAGWDYDVLKVELENLEEDGFNLDLTGFNDVELESLLDDLDYTEPEIQDLESKKEAYDNAEVKRIILMYSSDDFEEITTLAEQVRADVGIDDNSDLFKFLVEKYIGDNRKDEES